MKTTNYFKVGTEVQRKFFFFDKWSKASLEKAWSLALTAAQVHLDQQAKSSGKSHFKRAAEDIISVWEKPIETGPWEAAILIGERARGVAEASALD